MHVEPYAVQQRVGLGQRRATAATAQVAGKVKILTHGQSGNGHIAGQHGRGVASGKA